MRGRTAMDSVLVLVLASTLGNASVARAEKGEEGDRYRLGGLEVGLHYHTSWIDSEEPPPGGDSEGLYFDRMGHGITIQVGYGIDPSLGLHLTIGSADHKTNQDGVKAAHATLALELHRRFLCGGRTQPYLIGGLGAAMVRVDAEGYESEIVGGMAVFGLGLLYGLTDRLFLDASARLDLVNWNKVRVIRHLEDGGEAKLTEPLEESGTAGKIRLGILADLNLHF